MVVGRRFARSSHRASSTLLASKLGVHTTVLSWEDGDSAPAAEPSIYRGVRREGVYPPLKELARGDDGEPGILKMRIAGTQRWVDVQDPAPPPKQWRPPVKRKPKKKRWSRQSFRPLRELRPEVEPVPEIEPIDLNPIPCAGCGAISTGNTRPGSDLCYACRIL